MILYFSSNGHKGYGGLDVYVALGNSKNGFTGVVNMHDPVNSTKDDFGITFDINMNYGYFSSNRESGIGQDDTSCLKIVALNSTDTSWKFQAFVGQFRDFCLYH